MPPAHGRKTYPNTPLSEFKTVDTCVRTHGLDDLVDDEEEEKMRRSKDFLVYND